MYVLYVCVCASMNNCRLGSHHYVDVVLNGGFTSSPLRFSIAYFLGYFGVLLSRTYMILSNTVENRPNQAHRIISYVSICAYCWSSSIGDKKWYSM